LAANPLKRTLSPFRPRSAPAALPPGHTLIPREKNRLTLRAFLRQIVGDKRLVRSKALAAFLLADPLPGLSREEREDVQRRLEMDRLRLEEQRKFIEVSKQRAKEFEQWLREFKKELIQNRMPRSVFG